MVTAGRGSADSTERHVTDNGRTVVAGREPAGRATAAALPAAGPLPGPRRAGWGAGAARPRRWPGRRSTRAGWDPYLLAAGFLAVYATLSLRQYLRFGARSWDLGIFEQAVRSYAHLDAPVADLKGAGFVVLGDHFSPVIALLAPVYRLFPTPVTLLVAQAALLALAVVPVARGAAWLLGRAGGAAVGVAFGLSWGVQRAVVFDFHEICFAVPLVAFSLEAVVRRRWYAALGWAVPLLLVKEDLGMTAAAIAGVVAVLARRRGQPRVAAVALGLAVTCAAASLVTVGVVIPAANAAGRYDYLDKLGDDGLLATLAAGASQKVRTLLWLLLPTTGLLALRSPLLVAVLPTLAWRFAAAEPHYWGTDWHYNAVLMPVTALALADAVARTRDAPAARGPAWLRAYAHHLPTAVLAAALALATTLPTAQLTRADTYRPGPETAASVLRHIPDGAEVAANIRPISHLTGRCRVFWIGHARHDPVPAYVAYHDPGRGARSVARYVERLYPGTRFAVVAQEGGYVVLRRT